MNTEQNIIKLKDEINDMYTRNGNKSYNRCLVGKSGGKSKYVEEMLAQGYKVTEIPVEITPRPTITDDTKFIPIKRGLSIDEYLLQDVIDTFPNYACLVLTTEQAIEFLAKFPRLGELIDVGGIDSDLRDSLLNTLSRKLIDKSWPVRGTPKEEIIAFYKELYATAEKAGYKVLYGSLESDSIII